jgi:hypothetical protein
MVLLVFPLFALLHRPMSSSGVSSKPKRAGGVNYDTIQDRRIEDPRFEREKAAKLAAAAASGSSAGNGGAMSSTFDAFQRLAAGLEGRTIADKLADPNRPTWEQYKKDNHDKLDIAGADAKKMAEYRAQLDRDRELRLSGAKRQSAAVSSSDSSGSSSSSSASDEDSEASHRKKRKKKHKKKSKKASLKKKSKVSYPANQPGAVRNSAMLKNV